MYYVLSKLLSLLIVRHYVLYYVFFFFAAPHAIATSEVSNSLPGCFVFSSVLSISYFPAFSLQLKSQLSAVFETEQATKALRAELGFPRGLPLPIILHSITIMRWGTNSATHSNSVMAHQYSQLTDKSISRVKPLIWFLNLMIATIFSFHYSCEGYALTAVGATFWYWALLYTILYRTQMEVLTPQLGYIL